jgi:hypothetical protein
MTSLATARWTTLRGLSIMMFWLLLPILALVIIALLVWLDDDVDTPTTLRTLSVKRKK